VPRSSWWLGHGSSKYSKTESDLRGRVRNSFGLDDSDENGKLALEGTLVVLRPRPSVPSCKCTGATLPQTTCPFKFDLYFFYIDRAFGQPSFGIARFLNSHHWLFSSSMMAYWILSVPVYVLGAMYFLTQSRPASITYVRTLLLNFGLCVPLYLMVPVAGPAHAFDGFPWVSPDVDMPQAVSFIAIPNGFPSIHTSTALLILYFARRWKVGTILASVFLVLIVLSTLGLGEHYFIDLIAGALYSAAVIWLGDSCPATVPQPLDKRWKKRAFGYLPSTITVIGRGSHRFLR